MLLTITDTCIGPYNYSENIQSYKLLLVFNTIMWGKIVDIFDYGLRIHLIILPFPTAPISVGEIMWVPRSCFFFKLHGKCMTQSESTGIFNFSGHTVIGTDMDMKSMLIQSGWDFLCILEWKNCLFHVICKWQSTWPWRPRKLILRPWRKLTIGWSYYVEKLNRMMERNQIVRIR